MEKTHNIVCVNEYQNNIILIRNCNINTFEYLGDLIEVISNSGYWSDQTLEHQHTKLNKYPYIMYCIYNVF